LLAFLRRRPKDGRAAFSDFLAEWEKLLAFEPRERRDPAARLVEFLRTIEQATENGKRQLLEAGQKGTPAEVEYLLDTVSRLPCLRTGNEDWRTVIEDPRVSWEKLENDLGVAARVVNRLRVYDLQAVSGPSRERVDRLRERTRELARWADRGERFGTEYTSALQELEAAVTELDRTLEEHELAHPEYRVYLKQLAVLHDLRETGLRALLGVELPEGVAAVAEALRSPQPERARLALEVLMKRKWQPETLEHKLDLYCAQAKQPELRAQAVASLAELITNTDDPAVLIDQIETTLAHEGLTDLQEEGLPDLRAGLLERLAALGGDQTLTRLKTVLDSPTEPAGLKQAVIGILPGSGLPGALGMLLEAMSSLETEVRLAATRALAGTQVAATGAERDAVLDRLAFALRDGEPVVRDAAVQALRNYPDAVGRLARVLLEDRNPAAREAAARTFTSGLSPDPTSTTALTQALSDEDAAVRRTAADALAAQGRAPTAPPERLKYLCAKQDWRAVRQLGPAALPQLVSLLNDRDEEVRLGVLRLLGSLRTHAAADEVSRLLSDTSQEVRGQAAMVLAGIGSKKQAAALKQALAKEGFEEVRREMEIALRRLEK